MPERCPICNQEECAHTKDEQLLKKQADRIVMLERAIDGWRGLERYRIWVSDHFAHGLVTCECGEIDGCDGDAADVWIDDEGIVWALCRKCLKCHTVAA